MRKVRYVEENVSVDDMLDSMAVDRDGEFSASDYDGIEQNYYSIEPKTVTPVETVPTCTLVRHSIAR